MDSPLTSLPPIDGTNRRPVAMVEDEDGVRLLPDEERAVVLTWLSSEPLRGGATEFLRELGSAVDR